MKLTGYYITRDEEPEKTSVRFCTFYLDIIVKYRKLFPSGHEAEWVLRFNRPLFLSRVFCENLHMKVEIGVTQTEKSGPGYSKNMVDNERFQAALYRNGGDLHP